MTDAEKFVRQEWPTAICHFAKQYWPGQGTHIGWMIARSPYWSGIDGFGKTEIEAWASAANALVVRKAGE